MSAGSPAPALVAHGLADAADLPLPFGILLWVTGAAVLGLAALTSARQAPAWLAPARTPAPPRLGLPRALARAAGHPSTARALQGVLLAALLLTVALAVAGPDRAAVNPVPRLVYGVFWAGLVPLSLLLGGGVWRAANPVRLLAAGLARLAGDPGDRTARPVAAGLGVWPAAVLLAVFTWGDLALPEQPRLTLLVVAAVLLATLAGTVRHGRAWLEGGDGFEVYARVLGSLSPLERDGDRLGLRSPRPRLARLASPPGLGGVVAVLLGADLFDGLLASLAWQNLKVGLGTAARVAVDSAGLAACVLLAGLLVWAATRGARALLPALLPVVGAYAVAHYLPVLLVEPQVALAQLSDPLGRGWDLLGTAGGGASYEVLPGALLASGLLLVLWAGHLAAVVVANDRAVAAYGRTRASAVQLPLRALLVCSALASVAVRFSGG